MTCIACGSAIVGAYGISLWGEATCMAHSALGECVLCGRRRISRREAGWATFTRRTHRCPTCVRHGVDTQTTARQHIPAVRTQMAALGVALHQRVRVSIVDPNSLRLGDANVLFGMTHHEITEDGTVDVVGIRVAAGLPAPHFGATLAHEIGHAWLAERGAIGLDLVVAEGVCELFAGAWLKKQRTPAADALRAALATNPNPIYGDGYRMVHTAVTRHGIHAVLDHLLTRRSLPP